VIGADGFIGRHLIAALATDGIATIGYTRRHELDWPVDPAHRPDTLFYLASSITPTTAEQYPQRVTADHLRFAALLARVARDPRPPVVVLTSSGGTVYDPDAAGPCRETDPTRAAGRYGQAKVALEELLRHSDGSEFQVAEVYAYYGDNDHAFEWLNRAVMSDPGIIWLRNDPLCKGLTHDPRYQAILKRVNLPAST
jgi:UDP-glucose 4-epimerase